VSLLTRLIGIVAGPPVGIVPGAPAPTPMREAAGVTVDADDDQWRRLSGDSHRDLSQMSQDRMQKMAVYLWERNALANRLIELPLAYLLAKGVRIETNDADAQKALDRHWNDGLNAWDIKLPKKLRELALFGEQCWPVFVRPNGVVRVGYLDPVLIATVVTDPDNAEQPIGVVTKKDIRGKARRYKVIVNVAETEFTQRTQEIRATFDTGSCFFFKVNDLCASSRGRSDILANMDWLDAYDEFLFGELDRAQFLRAFIWDVMLKGATEEEVKARAKTITAPAPGSVRVHNDAEEWTAETPSLQAADSGAAARVFRNHILGGQTLPPTWYADGEDANKANSNSMAEPTEKVLEMRQRFVGYMLLEVARFVLRVGWEALEREPTEAQQTILDELSIEWPEMTTKDTTKYASALTQCVTAAVAAVTAKFITRATAIRLVQAMASQLGVEFDADAEYQAVEDELGDQSDKDTFVDKDFPEDAADE
jgi:hypothetical protein